MKAIVFNKYGSPDVLKLMEVEKPTPKDDEVLIKIYATALNPLDWHVMRGAPFLARMAMGFFKPKFKILGADIAGKVEAVGENVKQFNPGDEVFGDIFSSGLGGLAEYVCTSQNTLVLKPEKITFEEAAAVPVGALTALTALREVGKVERGQKVLINGASGGVGTFTVQIARYFDAEVSGVCSTGNIEMVKLMGAKKVIDYTKDDLVRREVKYDLIVDNVGNLSVKDFNKLLTPGGIAAVVGFTNMTRILDISLRGGKNIRMVNVKVNSEDLNFLKDLLESGKIKSMIDKVYPLEKAAEAMSYLEEGHVRGKLIIKIIS